MAVIKQDFVIDVGATFNPKIQYAQPTFTVIPINAITKSGRAVVTAEGHGLTTDWSVYVVGVQGMSRINHKSDDLNDAAAAYIARFVDPDTLMLEFDTSAFGAYTSGGELLYRPPVDLTGFTGRMTLRESADAEEALLEITTASGGVLLGGASGIVEILIDSDQTEDLSGYSRVVYDLEIVDPTSTPATVTRLLEGHIRLNKEVTR